MRVSGSERSSNDASHDSVAWLRAHVSFRPTDSASFWYERMASQSGRQLPIIYQPFDGRRRAHFVDRGQILDFALSVGSGRILDFGPGDGWPALMIAPQVCEVVGVDASRRRVETCSENASRLGLPNTRFVHTPSGQPMPFDDESFDGATAASSIEQTPNPLATLRELLRVLKPGGRLRMRYESLARYGREQGLDLWLGDPGEYPGRLTICERHADEEYARHFGLLLDRSTEQIRSILGCGPAPHPIDALTPDVLEELCTYLLDAVMWVTRHPTCRTWLRLLAKAEFRSVRATYDGGWFSRQLFDRMSPARRPRSVSGIDELLRPLVKVVLGMDAPVSSRAGYREPAITAIK